MKGRHAKLEPASAGEGSLFLGRAHCMAWAAPLTAVQEQAASPSSHGNPLRLHLTGSSQPRPGAKLWHFLSAGHQGCLWEPLPRHRRAPDVGEAERKRDEKRDLGVHPCNTATHRPPLAVPKPSDGSRAPRAAVRLGALSLHPDAPAPSEHTHTAAPSRLSATCCHTAFPPANGKGWRPGEPGLLPLWCSPAACLSSGWQASCLLSLGSR